MTRESTHLARRDKAQRPCYRRAADSRRAFWILLPLLLPVLLGTGCRSTRQLPPLDLSSPGWTIRQGQALWKPSTAKPELAGELLVATNALGHFFVQFTKTPFPLASAQRVGERWEIDLGGGEYLRRGHGRPPNRFVWFVLPETLATGKVEAPWHFQSPTTGVWRLENTRTGEVLEGYLKP